MYIRIHGLPPKLFRPLEIWRHRSLWSTEKQTLASNTAGREPLSGFLCLCFLWNPLAPVPRKLWLDIQRGQQRGRTQSIAPPGSVLPRALILLSCDVTGCSNSGNAIIGLPLKACREPSYQVLFLKPPCMGAKYFESCPALCHGMDCSLPGSFVQRNLQARILELIAVPSSRVCSQPKDGTHIALHLLHWPAGSLPLASPGKPKTSQVPFVPPQILGQHFMYTSLLTHFS